MTKVIKKDGTSEDFDQSKIISAVSKSAERSLVKLNDNDYEEICNYVERLIDSDSITVRELHNIVEVALSKLHPKVAKSYKEYRNYKRDFVNMLDEVYKKSQKIKYIGDRDNANTDSSLVSTKRCLVFNELNKNLYRKFFMTNDELQACKDGYIYIHDQSARLDTMNCCLFDVAKVMKNGFEMGNIWYNEPKSLDVAFDVIGDIVLSCASQQYGGFTIPEIDKILYPYAVKSYKNYTKEYLEIKGEEFKSEAHKYACKKVIREFNQGFQGLEMKLNTVGSSRGDYPFITISFGLGTHKLERLASISALKTRMQGQGAEGKKKPVLFPKLVFLYDKDLCNGINKEVYEQAILCSSKTMYPDWLSLTGKGYVPSIYKKYKRVVSPMGCRAFLSPWFEHGGSHPVDENDKPIFVGRFNIGVVSLHLPMILAKSRAEGRDFYEVLDYYLQMIRNIHIRTYEYLGNLKASINPVGFCEGGFLGGNLKPSDKIKPVLKAMTASFGITALNELQRLYNGKSLVQDGNFALEVMQHINMRIEQFKKEDGYLYAIYGTPAESLCGLQIEQFRKLYGIVPKVSDKPYVSNSFHCHVSENISPIEKQDIEYKFWDTMNGGKIQYVRYPLNYNIKAIKALINRAMEMGYYEGVNLSLAYCEECGYEQLDMDTCPKCGSNLITKIDRMNGYLGFTRVHGKSRYNDAKISEIKDRVSM